MNDVSKHAPRSLLASVALASFGRVGYIGVQFATHLIAAAILGVAGYGVLQLAITWIVLASAATQLGLHRLPMKLLPLSGDAAQREEERSRLTVGLFGTAVAAFGGSVLLISVVAALGNRLGGDGVLPVLAILGISVAPMNVALLLASMGVASEDPVPEIVAVKLGQPLMFLLALVLAPSTDSPELPAIMLWGYVGSWVGSAALAATLLWRRHPGTRPLPVGLRTAAQHLRAVAPSSLRVFASDVAYRLRLSLDLLLVGAWFSPATTGSYALASRLAGLLVLIKESANGLATARLRLALRASDELAAKRLFLVFARSTGRLTALAAGALAGAAPFALGLFGSGFADGATYLVVMSGAAVAGAMAGPSEYLLIGLGRERQLLRAGILAVLVLTTLGLLARSAAGAVGVAVAALVATLTYSAAQIHQSSSVIGSGELLRTTRPALLIFSALLTVGFGARIAFGGVAGVALTAIATAVLGLWIVRGGAAAGTLWDTARESTS